MLCQEEAVMWEAWSLCHKQEFSLSIPGEDKRICKPSNKPHSVCSGITWEILVTFSPEPTCLAPPPMATCSCPPPTPRAPPPPCLPTISHRPPSPRSPPSQLHSPSLMSVLRRVLLPILLHCPGSWKANNNNTVLPYRYISILRNWLVDWLDELFFSQVYLQLVISNFQSITCKLLPILGNHLSSILEKV